jgi:hypothetical protein
MAPTGHELPPGSHQIITLLLKLVKTSDLLASTPARIAQVL